MSVVNLNKTRKTKKRAEAKAQADQNAIRFGQSKATRLLEAMQAEQASKRLDQLKFEEDG